MKLVKATRLDINTDHNGTLLNINSEGVIVEDAVASELHIKFGHLIDITDIPEESLESSVELNEEEAKTNG